MLAPQKPLKTMSTVISVPAYGDVLANEQHEMSPDYLWPAYAGWGRAHMAAKRAGAIDMDLIFEHSLDSKRRTGRAAVKLEFDLASI